MYFISPTKGTMSFSKMFEDILTFVSENPESQYKLIVGSDSQAREQVCFVTAVVIYRIGKGARYYYTRSYVNKMPSMKQRIFYEAHLSLDIASKLAGELSNTDHSDLNIEIHLDIGRNGETKTLIKDLVAQIVGSGFAAKIKPDAYGASQVADKHSK
ncbi:MAG: ribonuclease H-like YkuK family protein [Firmicutes bacterium]|nr:ribonuclease H-like YkuK family protein [Candidatus Fermentithermobacillaceae bacterium]